VNLPRTTAQQQRERLLYIIPAAARRDGVRVADLAQALDVAPGVVLRDLREATARSFDLPAGAVETFTLFTDGRRVYVNARQDFHRPVRLTQREALALGLGLRALAADAEPERRAEILALATRLEQDLAAPDVETVHEQREVRERREWGVEASIAAPPGDFSADDDSDYDALPSAIPHDAEALEAEAEPEYEDAFVMAFNDDGFRGVVADAIELGRTCTIWYLKPGDAAPQHRSIAPFRLLYASGMWYVAAHDLARNDLRIFRMDRVLDATLEGDVAPPIPDGVDQVLASNGHYTASDDIEVSVRYSPRVARWILEGSADMTLQVDGSVVVQHRVADPRWIVRHVLQYGGEAVIEEPAMARRWVADSLAAVGGRVSG
jgi:predicted DNA-binding transcriptional regulator YafY